MGNIQRYTPVRLYPKAPHYSIIIIVDTVLRQKRNVKHEKQQYRHIATLACMTKACPPPGQPARHTSTVRNIKKALFEKIVLLVHPHVDVPYSLVVTYLELGWRIVST